MSVSETRFPAGARPLSGVLRAEEQRRTAHEYVRDTLRRAILSGALAGGTRLVQADIAAQLNVSTTPVREALRDLAADGLIRFDPHRGGVVNTIDADEFQEIYEIRKRLEPYAVRRAAERISERELEAAAAMAAAMEREADPGVWTELNWRFHGLLVQAARSPRLEAVLKGAQDAAALYVARSLRETPSRIEQGNAEHRALLEAMRRRDGDAVERILFEHLEGTLAALKEPSQRESS
jgi:DNA-binding GntR family transcriptional regulator